MRQHSIKVFIALLCCAAVSTVTAQSLWNKTYVEGKPTMLFSSIFEDNETFNVVGVISGHPNNLAKGFFGTIVPNGGMDSLIAIEDSINARNGFFWNTLIRNYKDEFCSVGFAHDSLPSLTFTTANKNLDSVRTLKYYTPNTSAFQGYSLLQFDSVNYFITGVRTDGITNNADIVLLKIDEMGNRIWEKYYNSKQLDYANRIVKLSNGNLLLGAVRNDVNQTNERANTWLLEVDTGGNIVRQWFDPNDSTYAAEGLRQTQDGGFIYGAQKKREQSVNDVYKTSTIVKLDSNFNKQWVFDSDTLSPTGFTDIEILPDGSYIACGSKNYRYAWIVKLRSTGQKIWSKEYVGIPDWGSRNYLRDIDVLPDGGLIAVGESQMSGATPPQVGWFLKLDSNGCEIENCILSSPSPLTPEGGTAIRIQPNPATNFVQVETENEMLGAELRVYDVTGKLMLNKTVVEGKEAMDVSGLNSGMYVIIAEKQGKFARAKLVVE